MPEDRLPLTLRTELQTMNAELRAISSDMQAARSQLLLEMEATRIELPLTMHNETQPLKDSIREIQTELRNLRLCVETQTKPQMKRLTETRNFSVSSHQRERYKRTGRNRAESEFAAIRREIKRIQSVLAEHSGQLAHLT